MGSVIVQHIHRRPDLDWVEKRLGDRRWQLTACVVAMLAIASPQYTWTLFTIPLVKELHAQLSEIQIAFTLFIVGQSWLVPFLGYIVDCLGARGVVATGGVLVGASWVSSGVTHSLWGLYVSYAIGGVGVAAVYGACMGLALKWFPERRGLAAGLVVGAYGSGAALLVVPIRHMIEHGGYRIAFLEYGSALGLVLVLVAWPMMAPYAGWKPPRGGSAAFRNPRQLPPAVVSSTPVQMIRSGAFHLMYVLSVLVMFGGLLVGAQLKPIATAYGLDKVMLLPATDTLSLALMASLSVAAIARPFWGVLSDRIGRDRTMAIAFAVAGGAILGLLQSLQHPLGFVVFVSLTAFAWGASFVLFSAAIGDIFGSAYAATNCGIHYTSKGVAAIFAGWGAAKVLEITGSWLPVLWIGFLCNVLAAVLTVLFFRPMIARLAAQRAGEATSTVAIQPAHSEGHGD